MPNYYGYELEVNGRRLTNKQKSHFFNCVNKIYRENNRFVYRGDKIDRLHPIYGDNGDEFDGSFFTIGAKGRGLVGVAPANMNGIDIAGAGDSEFRLIFRMLANLLGREFPFGPTRRAMKRFRADEEKVVRFFREPMNEQVLIDTTKAVSEQQQIIIRDYYLALLHHISKSEYYPSSFLLSTTTNFSQAHKFAWKDENVNSNNPIILFGWVAKKYEGVLSVPDSRILRRKIDMDAIGLPVYEMSFFHAQEEITLKGGLLPHYLLGYLHFDKGYEIFKINPALFQVNDLWDGRELPIDQSTFHERIGNTLFGRYFTVDSESGHYRQHDIG